MVQGGRHPSECLNELRHIYGNHCLSETQVRYWCRHFEEGDINTTMTKDRPRPGRPCSQRTAANIQKIGQLIQEDRTRSIRQLSELSGLSNFVILTILKKDLQMTRKFVPCLLTDHQKEFRVRLCEDNLKTWQEDPDGFLSRIITGDETWLSTYEPERKHQSAQWTSKNEARPQKAIKAHGSRGVMFTLFFDAQGPILCEFLGKGETIDSNRYQLTLSKLKDAIRKKRPHLWVSGRQSGPFSVTHKFLLHQDNAPSHVAVPTLAKFSEWGIELVPHLPYSPDLAPCDFSVPQVKGCPQRTPVQEH